jgi:hypothetical protein
VHHMIEDNDVMSISQVLARMVSNFHYKCFSCVMRLLQNITVFRSWDKDSYGIPKML